MSITAKVIGIIGILIFSGVVWWLASPLFLDGPMSNQTIDLDDPNTPVLATGTLVKVDDNHWGEGLVRLVNTSAGQLEIQFIDVNIANGPGLVVYLSDKSTFSDRNDDPGNYVDLGALEALSGNFTVSVTNTPSFDIKSVLIWCDPFSVVFTYATMNYQ